MKFTIVVPTRDRLDNLKVTCEHLLKINYDSYQILISDNCSEDGTYEYIKRKYDGNEKVKIIQTPERLPMSLNWDFALRHLKSEYVTIIGDDDGIHYDAFTIVSGLFQKYPKIDFIRSNTSSFHWPSTDRKGQFISSRRKFSYSIRESHKVLTACMIGARPYTDLPMLYNGGFLRVKALNRYIDFEDKKYFYKSINPDVFSAVFFACNLPKYIYVHYDLAVNGASKHSNGHSSFTIQKGEKKVESEKFSKENNLKGLATHKSIPNSKIGTFVPAGAYFVYESYFQYKGAEYKPSNEELYWLIFACNKTTNRYYKLFIQEWVKDIEQIYSLQGSTFAHKIKMEIIWLAHKIPPIKQRLINKLSRQKLIADSIDNALTLLGKKL